MSQKIYKKMPLLLCAATAASLFVFSLGCGVDGYSRQGEITHWHDDDTIILVYSREQTLGTDLSSLFNPEPTTMHVRVCTIQDDNKVRCQHQRRLTNMLNPGTVNDLNLEDRWRPGN